MGIDTRFWGPSGWQLFHLIAFRSKHPEEVLLDMKDILPCPFCRESTAKFMKESPPSAPYGKWLYTLHNKVNAKLRGQAEDDPTVIDPGLDPAFEEVEAKYKSMKPTAIPGRDFLMAVAYNYPETPEPRDMSTQREFLHHLADAYPFEDLRKVVQAYVSEHEPALQSQRAYTKWMHGLLVRLAKATRSSIRSYRGYMAHVAYYKSGCARKTYKGKTCRRLPDGGRTKNRNYKVTRRVVGGGLL
jgi:hypothetical protein